MSTSPDHTSAEPRATGVDEMPEQPPPPRLNALGNKPAPATLARDLEQLAVLSQAARDSFWELLEIHLHGQLTESMGEMAHRFAQAFELPMEPLVRLLRGCRLLMRSAAMADLAVEQVTIDLNVLCGETPEVVKQISAWYRQALPRIRSFAVLERLPDFGAVLEDVRVRKGYIPTSSHTPQVMTPLSMMTLCYREGNKRRRLTVQLTPQVLALLRARCEELS